MKGYTKAERQGTRGANAGCEQVVVSRAPLRTATLRLPVLDTVGQRAQIPGSGGALDGYHASTCLEVTFGQGLASGGSKLYISQGAFTIATADLDGSGYAELITGYPFGSQAGPHRRRGDGDLERARGRVRGREVATPFTGSFGAEPTRTVALDTDGLPAGIYFVRVESGEQVRVRKLTVMR